MKMAWLLCLLAAITVPVLGLLSWRQFDHRADRAAWNALAEMASDSDAVFDLSIVADLPEPAQRYFEFTIQPGTPLRTSVRIQMTGEISLGTKAAPNYQLMQAQQILAPPHGLVWKLKSGGISGSDGAMPDRSWTRFWLFNLIPVVRAEGPDHHRSAFGRVVAEAVFWAPASLLPANNVTWESVDQNTARAERNQHDAQSRL